MEGRSHLERGQPLARIKKFGLLEKHKDYVLRARDHHSKQNRLKSLKEKARNRNEDEFYFGMIKSGVKVRVGSVGRSLICRMACIKFNREAKIMTGTC